jgi:hypothetical protein
MFTNDFKGNVDPAEELTTPLTRLITRAALIVAHYLVEEALDTVENADSSKGVLAGFKVERFVSALHLLYRRFKGLALMGNLDQGRTIHLYVFFTVLSCCRGTVFLSPKVIAVWDLALVWDFNHSYFLWATVHFEIIEVVDAGPALDWLHFLKVVLLEVIAHRLLVIIIKKCRRSTL